MDNYTNYKKYKYKYLKIKYGGLNQNNQPYTLSEPYQKYKPYTLQDQQDTQQDTLSESYQQDQQDTPQDTLSESDQQATLQYTLQESDQLYTIHDNIITILQKIIQEYTYGNIISNFIKNNFLIK